MTTVDSPFVGTGVGAELARRKFVATEGDQLTLLNVYRAFADPHIGRRAPQWAQRHGLSYAALRRAAAIRTQLDKYVARRWRLPVTCATSDAQVRRSLVCGFFRHAARVRPDGAYEGARGAVLHAHPTSVFASRRPASGWVVFQDVLHTSRAYMRDVCAVEPDWLCELAPHYYAPHR